MSPETQALPLPVPWSPAPWRRALVYGLGLSGRAAATLLRERGVEVVAVDRRGPGELDLAGLAEDPGVELVLGRDPQTPPPGIDGVVVSPGVPMDRPLLVAARERGLPVIAEVELAFPHLDGPIAAVTGSNGKSTTTALTGALLEAAGIPAAVCGNIGLPLTACVGGPSGRAFVVELSSFQLEGIATFRPRAAALLNLAPDHLDRYPDLAAYALAKRAIFAHQREEDVAVLNADDPEVARIGVRARRRFFSRLRAVEDGCWVEGDGVVEAAPGEPLRRLFALTDLPLAGVHNLENAMAACLLARALGAGAEELVRGLKGFRGLPHRLERVGEERGIVYYDDSKGTNPAATIKSLEGFPDGSVHLILGGRSKGTDFSPLVPAVRRKARRAYLIGEAADELERTLENAVAVERCAALPAAVAAATRRARTGEAVVLSPACASFDQYRDFAERGEHFKRLVQELLWRPVTGRDPSG